MTEEQEYAIKDVILSYLRNKRMGLIHRDAQIDRLMTSFPVIAAEAQKMLPFCK